MTIRALNLAGRPQVGLYSSRQLRSTESLNMGQKRRVTNLLANLNKLPSGDKIAIQWTPLTAQQKEKLIRSSIDLHKLTQLLKEIGAVPNNRNINWSEFFASEQPGYAMYIFNELFSNVKTFSSDLSNIKDEIQTFKTAIKPFLV